MTMTMRKLHVLAEHDNEFGKKPNKKPGDRYEAPEGAAQGLVANKYCEFADAPSEAPAKSKEG